MGKLALNPDEAVISVRDVGGTYLARAKGLGITASCTSGAFNAAVACAMKVWPKGFVLKPFADKTWVGTSEEVALKRSTLNGEVARV